MAQSLSTEQLKDVLTYPFKDPDWKRKLAIAFAIAFFSFVIPLVFPWIFLMGSSTFNRGCPGMPSQND